MLLTPNFWRVVQKKQKKLSIKQQKLIWLTSQWPPRPTLHSMNQQKQQYLLI